MTVFQYVAIGLLGLLVAFSFWNMVRGRARRIVAIAWILVWTATACAILWPESITTVAKALGIRRGADLVLYGSVLAGLMGFFYLLTKQRATQRQITMLTRRMAIDGARRPSGEGGSEGAAPGSGGGEEAR